MAMLASEGSYDENDMLMTQLLGPCLEDDVDIRPDVGVSIAEEDASWDESFVQDEHARACALACRRGPEDGVEDAGGAGVVAGTDYGARYLPSHEVAELRAISSEVLTPPATASFYNSKLSPMFKFNAITPAQNLWDTGELALDETGCPPAKRARSRAQPTSSVLDHADPPHLPIVLSAQDPKDSHGDDSSSQQLEYSRDLAHELSERSQNLQAHMAFLLLPDRDGRQLPTHPQPHPHPLPHNHTHQHQHHPHSYQHSHSPHPSTNRKKKLGHEPANYDHPQPQQQSGKESEKWRGWGGGGGWYPQ